MRALVLATVVLPMITDLDLLTEIRSPTRARVSFEILSLTRTVNYLRAIIIRVNQHTI